MSSFNKDSRYSWFYLVVNSIVSFFFIGLCDSIGIIVAVFVDLYKEDNTKGGWLGSIILFLVFSLAPIVVQAYHRYGFRWCIFISSVLYSLSFVLTLFAPNMNYVFFTFSLPFGISTSFTSTLSIITLRDYFNKKYGFAVGIRYSAGALGSGVMSCVLPIIFHVFDFHYTLLILLALCPLFLLYGIAGGRNVTTMTSQDEKRTAKHVYMEFLQDKSFTFGLVAIVLFVSSLTIPHVFMVRYGISLGYSLSKAKWLLIGKGLMSLVGTFLAGPVSDKALRHRKVKWISLTGCILFGLFTISCSFARSFPLIMAYMMIIGLVEGAWWALYPVLVVEMTFDYCVNEAYGIVSFVMACAILPWPPFLGWLFDVTGDFRYVLYIISVNSLLAAFLLFLCTRVTTHSSLAKKITIKNNVKNNNEPTASHVQRAAVVETIYETSL